jgi:hypothetical protein
MNKILFPGLVWILLLLIPLTLIGFWPTYFSKLFETLPSVFHIHAFFMTLWIALALTQPLLISLKKHKWHKTIGRISYLIMPMIFLAVYFMIRYSYYHELERLSSVEIRNKYNLTNNEIYQYAAAYQIKALIDFIWLIVFYTLAIIYRKRVLFHATYMVAAIFTLLGPTFDRVMGQVLNYFEKPFAGFVEYVVFFITLLFFFLLMIFQRQKGNTVIPSAICFSVYALGVLGYKYLPLTTSWQSLVELIM